MKLIFLIIFTLQSFSLCSEENWHSKKPIVEHLSTITVRNLIIDNSYSIIEEPTNIPNFGHSIEFSINNFHPFTKAHHISKVNGEVIYDQYYESEEYGLRKIPTSYVPKKPTHHLIIAGDSNTFGEGVLIQETLPILLSNKIPGAHPYNWGIRGGGPNNTLAMMEFFPWENLIKEKKGIFIYNYYDFLIERVIGFKNYILWSKGSTPYYKLDSDGVATYQGNFNTRFLTRVFQAMNSVKWIRDLFPILPKPRYEHSVILGKIFLKMYDEYKNKFPEGQFFVAINDNFHHALHGRLEDLQKELTKNKVPFIIVPSETYDEKYIFADLHLNPKGHKLEAELLLKVLPLNKIASKPNINSTNQN